ncbi:Lecithin:cholesterol/phospholipid:diacylglycerol acyltransferase family-containing protein [Strongyloides ratti]|uniref:Lecithin:cholesterol/phospholipid:diacylglycerol acyltransferase family-containing protein n=1 Tax=Strongyloides ratti TaxID=34506 RepID=A0A090L4P8_STRRB|nr:Lecithin:cholesterol/phospholipid:diacylglycerol acyltransferase family-containing protein [Strongyloides ratti]CEF64761.1 Lecithin:cholesterol/phospholipid:diacylglycerol acyltransferase family-containing protein [Strongyloides ratti]
MGISLYVFTCLLINLFFCNCQILEKINNTIYNRDIPKYQRKYDDPIKPGYPVILVPGFGGTRLEAKLNKPSTVHYICSKTTSDYFDIWLNLQQFTALAIDCFIDNMRMVFNNVTKKCENSPGVDIRTGEFGYDTSIVEWLDSVHFPQANYFATIADTLVSWGYRRNEDLRAAPFDWRLKPTEMDDFYLKFKVTIMRTSWFNNNRKVVLLGHSLGNIHINYFLHNFVDKEFRDRYIQSHIALAAPWGGSMQIVKLLVSGYNMEMYRILLAPSKLRPMQRTWGSSYLLFPKEPAWKKDEIFASSPKNNYTLNNINEFFEDLNYTEGYEQYIEAHKNTESLTNIPDVNTHCIHGVGISTPEIYGWSNTYYPDYPPDKVVNGDGDGTVNKKSLDICKMWSNKSDKVTVDEINNTNHVDILYHSQTKELLKKYLYKDLNNDN